VCDKDSGDLDEKENTMSVVISADERSRMAVIRRVGPVLRRGHEPSKDAACAGQESSAPATVSASGEHEDGAPVAAAPGGAECEGKGEGEGDGEGETITCSVFDLQAHPDFSFRMGDVVLRLEVVPGAEVLEHAAHTMFLHGMMSDDEHQSFTDEEGQDQEDEAKLSKVSKCYVSFAPIVGLF
jgi:hypothetical protein